MADCEHEGEGVRRVRRQFYSKSYHSVSGLAPVRPVQAWGQKVCGLITSWCLRHHKQGGLRSCTAMLEYCPGRGFRRSTENSGVFQRYCPKHTCTSGLHPRQ